MTQESGIFKDKYEDYSLEQLNRKLEELKKYLVSYELEKEKYEKINKEVDDNNYITNVESEIEMIESLIKEKKLISPVESKYYGNISKLLDISIFECKQYSKRIPRINATYYYNPARGAKSVIVSDDGSYLSATSSVNFDKHLAEFKTGRRNGNFNETIESNDKILKINCCFCNNEIVINCSKLPIDIQTLDSMCSNCKSFIKYRNLNYIDETKK